MKKMRGFLVLFFVVALGACENTLSPQGDPLPRLEYRHNAPIPLEVSSIDFEDRTAENAKDADYVPFVQPVSDTLRSYLLARYAASEGFEGLSFILEDVRLTKTYRPPENKIGAFMGVAGQDIYQIDIQLHARLKDTHGNTRGKRFNIGRKLSLSEHVSIAEREKRQLEALEALMADLDGTLQESFAGHFQILRYR